MSVSKLKEAVAVQIAKSVPAVTDLVVNKLVNEEINKRAKAVEQAIGLHETLQKQIASIGPDIKTFTVEGKEASANYSQKQIELLKQANEKFTKLNNAIEKAFDKNEWADLYKCVAATGNNGSEQKNAGAN